MSKHITEFDLQDAKEVKGEERLEWLYRVQNAIAELESCDVTAESELNDIYGEGFVEKELERLYGLRCILELDETQTFGINVTLKFSHGVDAESYEEAVKIIKSNFLEQYNIELEDHEIDPEEFDLRTVLDLLDANGFEDASKFLQRKLNGEEDAE